MIAHLVYFETLASINDETAPEWHSTVAGLVVLRLIDDWLDSGEQIVTTDVTGLRAVRTAIDEVSEGNPIRSILNGIVDKLTQAEVASLEIVAPNLFAYGRALQYVSKKTLAKDVYTMVVTRAQVINHTETLTDAAICLGNVERELGDLQEADRAYLLAEEAARSGTYKEGELLAQLGLIKITTARGNLPQADGDLDVIINTARQDNLKSILSRALHDRANVRALRKDYKSAVRFAYAALELVSDPPNRDRILADIAAAFGELGYWDAARDTHLIVVATAQEEWPRCTALINLIEIASLQRQETAFQDYRRQLMDTNLPPYLNAYYHLYAGKAYRTFGDWTAAVTEFQQAIQIAATHNFSQIEFLANEELEHTEAVQHQIAQPEWPDDLQKIAGALKDMRGLVETTREKIGATA